MKRLKWPRPPLVLGFVLGALIERYMFISFSAYGWMWLLRPAVIVILSITVYGLFSPLIKNIKQKKTEFLFKFKKDNINLDLIFMILFGLIFGSILILSHGWVLQSRLLPESIGIAGIGLSILIVFFHLFIPVQKPLDRHMDLVTNFGNLSDKVVYQRGIVFFGWCIFYIISAQIIGMLPALFVFLILYLLIHSKEKMTTTIIISVVTWLIIYILFHEILMVSWPTSLIKIL